MEVRRVEDKLSGVMAQMHMQANVSGLTFSDCMNVEHKPGASLFEPINGNPFVVTLAEDKTVTRHTFKPDNPASGTDKLRARIIATTFYEGINQ